MEDMSDLPSITERVEAFRKTEIPWLVKELGDSIANLGYPVGMGVAPNPDQLHQAAEALFERWCKMASRIATYAREGGTLS